MLKGLIGLLLLGAWAGPAFADGTVVHRHVIHHRAFMRLPRLPPERHVVEQALPPGSGVFRLNDKTFTALTPSCARWVAGERIKLVAGDWHGQCVRAVFYNFRRRQTCMMACGS